MKRALMYASVASMIQQFNMENIRLLLGLGYTVDVACNMENGSTISTEKIAAMKQELQSMGVSVFHVPVPRNITAVGDILSAYSITKKLIGERKYDLIHCHSPIGGMICRIANRFSGRFGQAKMIYTAHGFHFFKGAPKKNWLMFYPIEWVCSRYTDTLITINQEDYALAKRKMKAKQVAYVPGVGIDIEKHEHIAADRVSKKQDLGIPINATLLLSVGELNENKNHETVIKAIADSDLYYIVAGKGKLQKHLQEMIEQLGLTNQVRLLGFREDVVELYKTADIFVFPSFREGLSAALMEAMACSKAVCCSAIRGNVDLVDTQGGTLFDPADVASCRAAIQAALARDLEEMGKHNRQVLREFSLDRVNEHMLALYAQE